MFAPYADMLLWPTPSLQDFLNKTKADKITLAFITARGQEGYWGGIQPPEWSDMVSMVKAVGPDKVICSFGGANGIELAWAITDEDKLFAEYKKIIDLYGFTEIDMDIEGAAIGMFDSVQRRNNVIVRLNRAYPNLKINYCLPVMPFGLTNDGINLLRDAKFKGCKINLVNVMTMVSFILDHGRNSWLLIGLLGLRPRQQGDGQGCHLGTAKHKGAGGGNRTRGEGLRCDTHDRTKRHCGRNVHSGKCPGIGRLRSDKSLGEDAQLLVMCKGQRHPRPAI